MDESKRSCFEDQMEDQQKKSSHFNLEDYSFLSKNNHHRPASEGKKNSSTESANLAKTSEKDLKAMEERTTDSNDESLIALNSLEHDSEKEGSETDESIKDKKDQKKNEADEEEGTYEELICLVRQFYVEKPINPAALAHQNIETC